MAYLKVLALNKRPSVKAYTRSSIVTPKGFVLDSAHFEVSPRLVGETATHVLPGLWFDRHRHLNRLVTAETLTSTLPNQASFVAHLCTSVELVPS